MKGHGFVSMNEILLPSSGNMMVPNRFLRTMENGILSKDPVRSAERRHPDAASNLVCDRKLPRTSFLKLVPDRVKLVRIGESV